MKSILKIVLVFIQLFRSSRVPVIFVGLLLFFLTGYLYHLPTKHLGAARIKDYSLSPGNMKVPQQRTIRWNSSSPLIQTVLHYWASQNPTILWNKANKGKVSRIMLAKLTIKQDLDGSNSFLLNTHPWGNTGSSWSGHRDGDYDFELPSFTAILWLYGDKPDILYPTTRKHLLENLLVEEGSNPRVTVPNSLGLVVETENHILMTEGSRYLKNRWLMLHGDHSLEYDNDKNGLTKWLLNYLNGLEIMGLYEFNSNPYKGFTITALMNLQAFGCAKISDAAQKMLDRLNWQYALGSLSFRHFPPFRRSFGSAGVTDLIGDGHTALVKVWMSFEPEANELSINEGLVMQHALFAVILPYRLPDRTAQWIQNKSEHYLVCLGHGPGASPEIYSGGPGYLFSAGGAFRGIREKVVPRPTVLLINDKVKQLKDVLHLYGPGDDYTTWNNTGVYKNFACAAGEVHIPDNWKPEKKNELWSLYHPKDDLVVAVHSQKNRGIVALFHTNQIQKTLQEVTRANPEKNRLENLFSWPNGHSLTYELHAASDKWVMSSFAGAKLDRSFDQWPSLESYVGFKRHK